MHPLHLRPPTPFFLGPISLLSVDLGLSKMICQVWFTLNPLIPISDKHLISPYSSTTWSNIQVMRIKEMIIKDKLSQFYANSPNQYHKKYIENSEENTHTDIGA